MTFVCIQPKFPWLQKGEKKSKYKHYARFCNKQYSLINSSGRKQMKETWSSHVENINLHEWSQKREKKKKESYFILFGKRQEAK